MQNKYLWSNTSQNPGFPPFCNLHGFKNKTKFAAFAEVRPNGIQNVEGKFVAAKSKNFATLHRMQPMTYSKSKSFSACSKCRKVTNGIKICGK